MYEQLYKKNNPVPDYKKKSSRLSNSVIQNKGNMAKGFVFVDNRQIREEMRPIQRVIKWTHGPQLQDTITSTESNKGMQLFQQMLGVAYPNGGATQDQVEALRTLINKPDVHRVNTILNANSINNLIDLQVQLNNFQQPPREYPGTGNVFKALYNVIKERVEKKKEMTPDLLKEWSSVIGKVFQSIFEAGLTIGGVFYSGALLAILYGPILAVKIENVYEDIVQLVSSKMLTVSQKVMGIAALATMAAGFTFIELAGVAEITENETLRDTFVWIGGALITFGIGLNVATSYKAKEL